MWIGELAAGCSTVLSALAISGPLADGLDLPCSAVMTHPALAAVGLVPEVFVARPLWHTGEAVALADFVLVDASAAAAPCLLPPARLFDVLLDLDVAA